MKTEGCIIAALYILCMKHVRFKNKISDIFIL